jgi:hypothetical protein
MIATSFFFFQSEIFNDPEQLANLRLMLLFIRVWSSSRDDVRPRFTKFVAPESLDVVAMLFSLVTRMKETPDQERLHGT